MKMTDPVGDEVLMTPQSAGGTRGLWPDLQGGMGMACNSKLQAGTQAPVQGWGG